MDNLRADDDLDISLLYLLTLYIPTVRSSLDCCSYIFGNGTGTLTVLYSIWKRAIAKFPCICQSRVVLDIRLFHR